MVIDTVSKMLYVGMYLYRISCGNNNEAYRKYEHILKICDYRENYDE
jgi:hypothetical protein